MPHRSGGEAVEAAMMQPEIEIAELLADLEEAAATPLDGAAASGSDSDDSDVPIIPSR